jgi:multidrug resistance protein, MATE family
MSDIILSDLQSYGSIPLQDLEDTDDEEDEEESYNVREDSNTSERLSIIYKFSYPVILAFLLSVSGNCIILYFAGYMSRSLGDTTIFGGVSLAITFTNVTLSSIIDGLSTAVETLSSQYNGAKNYRMVGLVLNRSIIVLILISLPIMIVWLYFDEIFTSIGISQDMIMVVGHFISWRFLSVPVEVLNLSYEKYLMSMGIMQPSLKACCVFNISLVLLNYIFVCIIDWGVRGIALAYVLSMFLELACLVLLSVNHPFVQRTLTAPTAESFRELGSFLMFGLSGCVMLCAEWWAYVS